MRNFSLILIGLLCTSVNTPEMVYEIETLPIEKIKIEKKEIEIKPIVRDLEDLIEAMVWVESEGNPVSYTHLTLPTILLV